MRLRTRRTIVSIFVMLGIAMAGTSCSSNDGQGNTNAGSSVSTPSSTKESSDETFEPEASLAPTPSDLDAEPAETTTTDEDGEYTSTPAPRVDSSAAREASLAPCEVALDRQVIDATVPGTAQVSLGSVKSNKPNSSSIKYSETCTYTARGADVAYVTSMLLTASGKERYRNACSGDEKFDDVIVNPIGYQYYRHVDDGCTLTPKNNAPAGTLPGFVLRYRDKMVIVRMEGFNKVAKDGASVIKEVTLKS